MPTHSQHYTRPCQALVPATGPQESGAVSARSERSISYPIAAALHQRNSVASTHIRWSTTPNLRARATLARFMPRRFRHVERPVLQAREAGCPRQHDVRRFKERGSHHGVADLADITVPIGLTGLIFFGRKPEVGSDRTGFSKPCRVIPRRAIGERNQGAWSHVIMPISLRY